MAGSSPETNIFLLFLLALFQCFCLFFHWHFQFIIRYFLIVSCKLSQFLFIDLSTKYIYLLLFGLFFIAKMLKLLLVSYHQVFFVLVTRYTDAKIDIWQRKLTVNDCGSAHKNSAQEQARFQLGRIEENNTYSITIITIFTVLDSIMYALVVFPYTNLEDCISASSAPI